MNCVMPACRSSSFGAVRDPVRAHRRAAGEHFLGHHVALERRALVAAVLFRPAHADVAALAALAAERGIEAVPGIAARRIGAGCAFRSEKLSHLAAQFFGFRRQPHRVEPEFVHGSLAPLANDYRFNTH
jgi:hypothetical protein